MQTSDRAERKGADVFPPSVLELNRLARHLNESVGEFRKLLDCASVLDRQPEHEAFNRLLGVVDKINEEMRVSCDLAIACSEAIERQEMDELLVLRTRLMHHMDKYKNSAG